MVVQVIDLASAESQFVSTMTNTSGSASMMSCKLTLPASRSANALVSPDLNRVRVRVSVTINHKNGFIME